MSILARWQGTRTLSCVLDSRRTHINQWNVWTLLKMLWNHHLHTHENHKIVSRGIRYYQLPVAICIFFADELLH